MPFVKIQQKLLIAESTEIMRKPWRSIIFRSGLPVKNTKCPMTENPHNGLLA